MANFVILAEIVPRTFIISAEIMAAPQSIQKKRVMPVSHPEEPGERFESRDDELFRLWRPIWQPYDKALEIWFQAERLVILNSRLSASACDDTADHASETAHNVRRALARAVVGKMDHEEELLYEQ